MVRIQKQAQHRSNIQIYRYIKGDLLIHLPCTVVTGVAAGLAGWWVLSTALIRTNALAKEKVNKARVLLTK